MKFHHFKRCFALFYIILLEIKYENKNFVLESLVLFMHYCSSFLPAIIKLKYMQLNHLRLTLQKV